MARNLWVAVFDLHHPKVHKPTWNAVLDFIRKNPDKIAGFIFGGDQSDNQEISHHTSGRPLLRPPGSYKANTEGINRLITQVENILPKQAEKVYIVGNHDYWEDQLVERQPELQGTVERTGLLRLGERGWEVLELGEAKHLGKLIVVHGEGLTGIGNQASIYHAKRAVESFCTSVLYGHLHTAQSYTKVLPHSVRDKWMAYSSPAACTTNPHYLQNRPTAWVNGFSIVELHDPRSERSNFNVYPVIVSDGRFSFGGTTYGA
jgi:predicted MPP superfamily phosphohydrolase